MAISPIDPLKQVRQMAGGPPGSATLRMANSQRPMLSGPPKMTGVQTMGPMAGGPGTSQEVRGAPPKGGGMGRSQTPPNQAAGARSTVTGMSQEQLRAHQLSIGGAAHMLRAGHISQETHDQIQGAARAKIAAHNSSRQGGKLPGREPKAPKPRRFGALSPAGMAGS